MDQEIAAVSAAWLYMLAGCALFAAGVVALFRDRHLLRQVIALNVIGGGVFLVMIASAHRQPDAAPDPVPHALVLTGIVVAVSAAALVLALATRLRQATGRGGLSDDEAPE